MSDNDAAERLRPMPPFDKNAPQVRYTVEQFEVILHDTRLLERRATMRRIRAAFNPGGLIPWSTIDAILDAEAERE